MKLKRIISALVVFTMVLTCAVCSVSADGTYNVTTSYDVSSGDITVNAAIAGGTPEAMVSYLIVAPEEVTTGEGEDATTTLSYDVKVDGSNILHIDQATLDASGAATMDAFTAEYAYLKGGKVKFVPTDGALSRSESGSKPSSFVQSVEYFSDGLTGTTFIENGNIGKQTLIFYVKEDGTVGEATPGDKVSASTWESSGMAGWYDGVESENIGFAPIKGVVSYIVVLAQTEGRDKDIWLSLLKRNSALDGTLNNKKTFTIYNSTVTPNVDLMVNGFYKDDITDGRFGDILLEPGAVIAVNKSTEAGTASGAVPVTEYMAIDSKPIYGTYKDNDGDFMSVTFLVSASTVDIADKAGLKIIAYPKGTLSMDTTIADSAVTPVELGICPNAYTGKTNFAIQLFDGANSGQLDPAQWDIEAVPVINEGTAEEPEWVELSVFGNNSASEGKFYSVTRTEQYTEAE